MNIGAFKIVSTNDEIIRISFRNKLESIYANSRKRIVEELGIDHGVARIDIAVINGSMHGYEIKSDCDTLQRLPEQMSIYNGVFDQLTLVVGKSHLYDAINIVPDWWGIVVAKMDFDGLVTFSSIREAGKNPKQDSISIARLLWKNEAIQILESVDEANGMHYKPRSFVYKKLVHLFDQKTLGKKVKKILLSREAWRVDRQPVLSGG